MSEIIRGTTPTIKYTFETVSTSDIVSAYLTAEQGGAKVIDKDMTDATVGTGFLAWTLTQAETLALKETMIRFMCNWKKGDGTRGASREMNAMVTRNLKDEVI